MFWYHPHAHGAVNDQILGGMSGGLVVDGSEQLFPFLQGLPERFLLIKHVKRAKGTGSSRSMANRIPPCKSAPASCSSGASPISALLCSSNSVSRGCRFTFSRPTVIRSRSRARSPSSLSAPASGSTRSPSARSPANTRCAPFRIRTKHGGRRNRFSNWRSSCPADRGRPARSSRTTFSANACKAVNGSTRSEPPQSPDGAR